jgi:hypothetical protein
MADLIRDFWWLAFPAFGMVMAAWGMAQEDRRIDAEIARWRRNLENGQ